MQPEGSRSALKRFGAYVRAVRERETELTQNALAVRMKCSERTVLDMENGKHLPQRQRLHAWERAIGPHPEAWELYRKAEHERDVDRFVQREVKELQRSYPSIAGLLTRQADVLLEEAEDVRREKFLTLIGSSLAGILAPPLVHGWPDSDGPPLPELNEALLMQLRVQTEGFRWLDRREGAAAHLHACARHARSLVTLWRATDAAHPLRTSLANITADACHLVAFQAFDQGQRGAATAWYRCASQLAERAGNQDLYVFASCGEAYMHAKNGDPAPAFALLGQLRGLTLSAAGRCYVEVYQAHGLAAANQLGLALEALDRAAASAGQVVDDAPSPWLGIPDLAFVDRQRAMVLAQFGRRDALPLLAELGQRTPAIFRRYRVTVATDQALTHARAGEIEQAVEYLTVAVRLNLLIRSAEKARQGLVVYRLLSTAAGSTMLKELDEAIEQSAAREIAQGRRRAPTPPAGP